MLKSFEWAGAWFPMDYSSIRIDRISSRERTKKHRLVFRQSAWTRSKGDRYRFVNIEDLHAMQEKGYIQLVYFKDVPGKMRVNRKRNRRVPIREKYKRNRKA